ncbi:MAG: hypothetical protein ACD_59C00036G0005 [uncultured bacterium]|nr:MAG: hypothetical protein ACD_59C00036G0005 [uncultured bacterium]
MSLSSSAREAAIFSSISAFFSTLSAFTRSCSALSFFSLAPSFSCRSIKASIFSSSAPLSEFNFSSSVVYLESSFSVLMSRNLSVLFFICVSANSISFSSFDVSAEFAPIFCSQFAASASRFLTSAFISSLRLKNELSSATAFLMTMSYFCRLNNNSLFSNFQIDSIGFFCIVSLYL